MFSRIPWFYLSLIRLIMPAYLIPKIIISKYFIHLTLYIVTRMPVTVDIDTTSVPQYSFHLPETSIEPGEIGWHPIFEYITEWSDFVLISPDLCIGAIREKWRVDIYEVDRLRGDISEDWEIVPEIELVWWEIRRAESERIISMMRVWWMEWWKIDPRKYMVETRLCIISVGLTLRIGELSPCTSRSAELILREELRLIGEDTLLWSWIFGHKKALTKVNARIRYVVFFLWLDREIILKQVQYGIQDDRYTEKDELAEANKKSGSTCAMWDSAKILNSPQYLHKERCGCKTAPFICKYFRV